VVIPRAAVMSALPPKADIAGCDQDVRFVPLADIADLLEKWALFLASSPQIAATRLFRPSCFAYRRAHPLTPPDSFINVRSRISGSLERATYRNARAHLLITLVSTVLCHTCTE
jgi:hypothetical protein